MNEMLQTLGENAREAEVILRNLGTAKKNQVLEAVADSLVAHAACGQCHRCRERQTQPYAGRPCGPSDADGSENRGNGRGSAPGSGS